MYLSLIENNRGFSRKKIWPSFPVSENEVKYSHLPEMKVEFYTLFQSQRGKKHIMLGDTDIRKATYRSTTSLVGLFCRSPKMVITSPRRYSEWIFPEAEGYRMISWKTWVSENFGVISKPQKQVSILSEFCILVSCIFCQRVSEFQICRFFSFC